MRVGSLVIDTGNLSPKGLDYCEIVLASEETVSGNIYTISGIFEDHEGVWLYFEEMPSDCVYHASVYREVVFPPSIEAEIAECLTRELQEC